jgi:putative sigma-54 modulation protein
MDMTDGLRSHVDSGLDKIRHHFDKVLDADVVLSVEKRRHIAEITLHANGLRIHGSESTEDMYAAIDAAVAKLDKQIAKHKKRIKRFKPRESDAAAYSHQIIEVDDVTEDEPDQNHRVIHHEKISTKPMTVDEAALQLELMSDAFFVFSNADTAEVNVLYARNDGTFGLIEPHS